MAFLRRLLFYAIGIGLGILIVLAFFGDRDFDYAYGPQERVKKNFRKKAVDSTTLVQPLIDLSRDSLYYRAVAEGRVAFGASDPRKEPCGEYVIRFSHRSYAYKMVLQNCDTVKVLRVEKEIN
ncbi:MAG TPA: hypothetical protein DIT65_05840 [Cryomorphaceae bacterium]|nr:hypothetical protein [Cryomorphaceae bacterium]|tara:strand:- start:2338 stop:2706 length:369 start_codon:yes stop_codon:yes gene_type:complete